MENRLKIILAVAILLFILVIINSIRKDNISLKYSLVWLASGLITIILVLVPNVLEMMSKLLGFELVSNMIYMIAIIILLVISFCFTVIVSRQTKKIRLLVQEVSLLKERVELLEDNSNKKKGSK